MKKGAVFLIKSPYCQIAKILNQKYGWGIFGFSSSLMIPNNMKEVCSDYLDLYTIIEKAKASPVPHDIISECKNIEEKYDLNLADIISADRHLGIGWVT